MILRRSLRIASRQFFDENTPHVIEKAGSKTWVLRGGNFVVAHTEGLAGEIFERDNPDEYFVYVTNGKISLDNGELTVHADNRTIAIVPPGLSRITLQTNSTIIRIFSNRASDLLDLATNANDYANGDDDFAPLPDGVLPFAGSTLRTYQLDDFADWKMRLFRCENLMINVFDHRQPRETTALTPHSHDDFEQGSFAVAGDWMHHLRRPWTPDISQWAEDEHLGIGSPSLTVIPAKMVHTSRSINPGYAQLLDVFAPPRRDFLAQGMVCNAAEYPLAAIPPESGRT